MRQNRSLYRLTKVSEIMKGSVQVTSLDVFERVAEGLRMPNPARLTLGLPPRHHRCPASPHTPRDGTPTSALLSVEQVAVGQRQQDDTQDVDVLTLAWIAGRLDAHVDRRTILILAAGMTAEAAAIIADPWAGRRVPAPPYQPNAPAGVAAPPHRCSPTIATAWLDAVRAWGRSTIQGSLLTLAHRKRGQSPEEWWVFRLSLGVYLPLSIAVMPPVSAGWFELGRGLLGQVAALA
ncbi:hypothetical protein [Nonomuraea sp. NPDC048916]|uniref:hypothetical protein n=1 Tax=Nonomuraea sp. NPDC048916 TaxID=3154232 RepID=UPI0033E51B92